MHSFIYLFLVAYSQSAFTQIHEPDCTAALNVWRAMNGSPSFTNGCTLPGVSLSCTVPRRIKEIYWYKKELSGSISSDIGKLTALVKLDLGYNKLSGPISPQIRKLTKLTHLVLYWNELSGPIPIQIKHLKELTVLALSGNKLSGSIPSEIGKLKKLTLLALGKNQLTGSIPVEILKLTKVTSLSLNGNQLTGSIPVEIENMASLRTLFLDNNQLSGAIPREIGKLTNLANLFLGNNSLTRTPRTLSKLTNAYMSLLPNPFVYKETLEVPLSNMDSGYLSNFLSEASSQSGPTKRDLSKRQQTTLYGEVAIKEYCPLDAGITREIVGGCLAGHVQLCATGDLFKCHNYYNTALANSKRYNLMGQNCPPWKSGPDSSACKADIKMVQSQLDANLPDVDKLFPISLRDNVFKNPKYAPCRDGAYQGLRCTF